MKIAIAGYGIEGQANYEYLRGQPNVEEIVVFDAKETPSLDLPTGVKAVLGPDAFTKIPHDFFVVRTAGLSPNKLPDYFRENHQILSSTIEFFDKCSALIIGVTGSKGKGTTASFIAEILRSAGKKVHLVGNIGVPALSQLPHINSGDIVVYEMSSFQLWDLEKSPQIAVITMIEPDHLDVHEDFADYVLAKSHIVKYQTSNDKVVYNDSDQLVREIAKKSPAHTQLPFPNKKFVHIKQGWFMFGDVKVCETDAVNLPGEHNKLNAMAAISVTWDLINHDVNAVKNGLSGFKGLPHRLQFVREVGGVKFYDDSIATTPGSAVAAIRSFKEPKILILGGYDKGADYTNLSKEIDKSNVKMVFTIGENRAKVASSIRENSDVTVHEMETRELSEIVQEAWQNTEPGDVVILSPAAASFGMFKDYKDRGEQFEKAVKSL